MLESNYYYEDAAISAWIANLGKYNEGELVGQWISFPISEEDLDEVLKEIQIGSCDAVGCPYEEFAFFDYNINIPGLSWETFGEYAQIETLNEAAEAWDNLKEYERDTVAAILEAGQESSVQDAIDNIDNYYLLTNVNDEYDLGYYYIEEVGGREIPEWLSSYIDYEAYGRDCAYDGNFTSYGFLERC